MHAIADCSDFEDDVVDGTNHEHGPCAANAARLGEDPTFPLPVVLGMMAWGGLYLRDGRLRELIPLRKM